MAQANMTIRLDAGDKRTFSAICENIGLSATAAINVFVKAVIRDRKIPFELSADSSSAADPDDFYNEANIRHLEELKRLDDEGKLHFISKTMEELEAMER